MHRKSVETASETADQSRKIVIRGGLENILYNVIPELIRCQIHRGSQNIVDQRPKHADLALFKHVLHNAAATVIADEPHDLGADLADDLRPAPGQSIDESLHDVIRIRRIAQGHKPGPQGEVDLIDACLVCRLDELLKDPATILVLHDRLAVRKEKVEECRVGIVAEMVAHALEDVVCGGIRNKIGEALQKGRNNNLTLRRRAVAHLRLECAAA
jgi:hypothetical protein